VLLVTVASDHAFTFRAKKAGILPNAELLFTVIN
jgi:hypothetical protein